MRALFLAAGFGTRLKEYGKKVPKGLIPMGESTLLGKALGDICSMRHDFSAIGLVTNGRFEATYRDWLALQPCGAAVQVVSDGVLEPEVRLGAIGDILLTVEQLGWLDEDLLVLSSDTYYQFSMQEFVHFAQEKKSFATVLRDMGSTEVIKGRLGCAVLENEQIVDFVEKPAEPPSTYAAIPFYYYPKEVLAQLSTYKKEGNDMDAPGRIIPWLLKKDIPVYGYVTTGETLDVGTLEDVEKLAKS